MSNSYLTIPEVLAVGRLFGNDAPRSAVALRSAVGEPRQGAFGLRFHKTTLEQAAVLLRGIAKNHPFVDGNKRTALGSLVVFLRRNGFELIGSDDEIVDFVVGTADGSLDLEEVIKRLERHTVPFSPRDNAY